MAVIWRRPVFVLVVLVLATIACANSNPTTFVQEQLRDDSGHSRVMVSEKPIPTPVIPIYVAPVIPVAPIVPVNAEPLHTLEHFSEFPGSMEIVGLWKRLGYWGSYVFDNLDRQVHVIQVAGKWCIIVVSKTTQAVITAYATGQTPEQLIIMLLKRGFVQIQ